MHPARAVAMGFLLAIVVGSALLMLPWSRADGAGVPWLTAFFTAVSAVCVAGLVVVDTGTYWSAFGQSVIMVLFQLGGFGMMTASTLLGLMVNRSLRLRTRLMTQAETHAIGLGDVVGVAKLVLVVTVAVEVGLAVWLAGRFHLDYGANWGNAAWNGLFHAVSAYNNAGFSTHADSLMRYAADRWVLAPVMLAAVIGGIGFPVLHDLRNKPLQPRRWSLHSKLTLAATGVLFVVGLIGLAMFEWSNPRTFGPMPAAEKLWSAAFASVSARTVGFNTVDIGGLSHESMALHYFLMFVGGGSASTAGGVKVGTIAILALLVIAEIRGRGDSEAFSRRVSSSAQRQAITVLVLGSALTTVGTLAILYLTEFPTDQVIFEVIAAFGSAGLSTGITADLPASAQLILALLMYTGRVGTITLAVSLAMSERRTAYRYPEEHPIVG
ncbi:trk system potassium uptake protein TrkH [Cupriavidus agavae]|uniref:Trk system potassium uptake protein TrkH n=2 Tax=Cupriavidus agavae TaxID=1001822 RepID=A0A4Q7S0C1_9BURK|nr:trk system potassium uptake protein TrkH [Cupriavidus agavae]